MIKDQFQHDLRFCFQNSLSFKAFWKQCSVNYFVTIPKTISLLLFVIVNMGISNLAFAAGPAKVASYDRHLWPETINTPESYNRASYFENKMFQNRLMTIPVPVTEVFLRDFTSIKKVNAASVNRWLIKTQKRIQDNLMLSQRLAKIDSEHTNIEQLSSLYLPWRQASEKFYQTYLYEQIRLAALFPRISSEIDTFTDQEITGFELEDGQFLLSFDDGPSSFSSQKTEKIMDWLTTNNVNGFFFLLGESLQKRMIKQTSTELAHLYDKQCMASHGYQHKKHIDIAYSTTSLAKTDALIQKIKPSNNLPAFRPPYGQRSKELAQQQINKGRKIVLWNIDSQDWNRKLNEQAVADRMTSLMLLWRKGILLFHDVHTKALFALPQLNKLQKANNNEWLDCKKVRL